MRDNLPAYGFFCFWPRKEGYMVQITCRGGGKTAVIALAGEIDHHGAKNAMLEIGGIINDNMPMQLELDFGGVSFMDSSGLAIIVTAYRRLREYGGRLTLTHVPDQAYRVISATGLQQLLEVQTTQMR